MIIYKSQQPLKIQILNDIKELESYKSIYNRNIFEYKQGANYLNSLLKDNNCNIMINKISYDSEDKIRIFNTQVSKIKRNIEFLNNMLEKIDDMSKNDILISIKRYNRKYSQIKNNIFSNDFDILKEKKIENKENLIKEHLKPIDDSKSILNENTNLNITDNNINLKSDKYLDIDTNILTKTEITTENNIKKIDIKNNDTLLISEILNVVILPYTAEEIIQILEDSSNYYHTAEDIIAKKFTRPLSDYKFQIWSRYNETIKLLTEREDFGLKDSISLAIEMMGKRYLHPAIISACRSLDELDVYLDCLDKNELDDFKIFKIKYELHPMIVKKEKIFDKLNIFKLLSNKNKIEN